jgi:NAD(P)H-dependent FMN reductase
MKPSYRRRFADLAKRTLRNSEEVVRTEELGLQVSRAAQEKGIESDEHLQHAEQLAAKAIAAAAHAKLAAEKALRQSEDEG